jgi:hypothetical protein
MSHVSLLLLSNHDSKLYVSSERYYQTLSLWDLDHKFLWFHCLPIQDLVRVFTRSVKCGWALKLRRPLDELTFMEVFSWVSRNDYSFLLRSGVLLKIVLPLYLLDFLPFMKGVDTQAE